MDDTMRGAFSSEHQEAAPPWSGGWLMDPMEAVEQPAAVEAYHRLFGGTAPKGHPGQDQCSVTFFGRNETQGKYLQAEEHKKKLFVGMAPKLAYEEDYKVVFERFGTPVEVYVIRDRNGFSKGCAFVKYESVKSASNAIEALHDKYIMAGGFRTLVVTVADDRREPLSPSSRNTVGGGDPPRTVRPPSPFQNDRLRGNSWSLHDVAASPGRPVTAPQPTRSRAATAVQSPVIAGMSHVFCGGAPPQGTYVYYPFVSSYAASGRRLSSKPHHAVTVGSVHGLAGQCNTCEISCGCAKSAGAPGQYPVYPRVHEDVPRQKCKPYDTPTVDSESKSRHWEKQTVGPPGANLFVYYLPGFLSDAGLATAFAPFGPVLSAKIYYDRDTGESKGFGFVSYADPNHADAAIARMNGFCVGEKRLKVVRKRGQQKAPDTSSQVSEPRHGGGGNVSTNIIPYLSDSDVGGGFGCSSFGCGGFGFDFGLGRDSDGCGKDVGASGRCDLKGEASLELDLGTPEGLLGPSMTRRVVAHASGYEVSLRVEHNGTQDLHGAHDGSYKMWKV